MATNRFSQHKYALVRYFRKKGYEVDSRRKTITVNPEELYRKDQVRLDRLKAYGFLVKRQDERPVTVYNMNDWKGYESSESFIDFADEIIAMCNAENITI